MQVKTIPSSQTWEQFVGEVGPPTFLQSWSWGDFNEKTNHKIWRLGAYENDQLLAVALVIKVTARRGSFLFIPHGPLLRDENTAHEVIARLTEFLKPVARQEGCAFIRISPLLEDTQANKGVFKKEGYQNAPTHMMHPELAWILDITAPEEKVLAGMRKTTRYSIKKAEKDGVTIRMSKSPDDLKQFNAIYQQTVRRQEFKAFPERYFSTELEVFGRNDEALLFFAEYKGEVIGTALIVFYGDSAFYHHGATSRKFPSLTDAQLLQWHVILEAKRRGKSFYNFWGVVPEEARQHPWWGLSTFKRGFGGVSQAYVHAQDLPLSARYWITYIVEKVRKIKRGL